MTIRDAILRPDKNPPALSMPLFMEPVYAGFPSPAGDYIEDRLDLNEFLIKHPAATFFVRAAGDSMIEAGIHHGDILIVDRALESSDNAVVIAVLAGELTVKRLRKIGDTFYLTPDNRHHDPILVGEETEVEIWGVVTTVIHPL